MPDGAAAWILLRCRDYRAMDRFLRTVLGFRGAAITTDPDTDETIHQERHWPGGGGVIVLGTTRHTAPIHDNVQPGTASVYLVSDDVAAIHERARNSGCDILRSPEETTVRSRPDAHSVTIKDPDGNVWTVGTHLGTF